MDYRISAVTFVALCVFIQSARSQCSFQQRPYVINETDPAGTVIFNVSKTPGTTATLQVVDPGPVPDSNFVNDLQSRFRLIDSGTFLTLITNTSLDLEEFQINHQKVITDVRLKITCDGQEIEVGILVRPVNEFPPVFLGSPYNVSVPESTTVGRIVFKLKPKVKDQDVGEAQNFIFKINSYSIIDIDGSSFFSIPASSQGNISVSKTLDYDNTNYKKSYRLNVSVADGQSSNSKIVFTDLNIFIQDVDDQVPYFDFPNCPKPCPAPPFEATTRLAYTGQLTTSPNPLRAKDDDTLGTPLQFSIQSGNQHNLFEINQNTGVVSQKTSVNALNLPDAEFRLVIEVRKNLTSVDLSSIAILTVHVWERMSNDSGIPEPPTGQSREDSGSSLLIPLIVLGVALAVVLVALIVVFVIYRRKQREMSVRPVDDKSEPQTEEEELHTDGEEYNARSYSNEKLIFGNKTTLGIMTDQFPETSGEKANRLPPLPMRDTATETTERRKKKSRRRNKNKEPEIFDGTREYNMGLDPEFFDSTDKSRVKRSQRSRKADSALPIQVPNDNPADEDSVHM